MEGLALDLEDPMVREGVTFTSLPCSRALDLEPYRARIRSLAAETANLGSPVRRRNRRGASHSYISSRSAVRFPSLVR